MVSPENQCFTSVFISPGRRGDNTMIAALTKTTGSIVTLVNRPEQLTSHPKPNIIASNGLREACTVADSTYYAQSTNIGAESNNHLEYPADDAQQIADKMGAIYVDLAPGRFRLCIAAIKESKRQPDVVPAYCTPFVAKLRIGRAMKAAEAVLQATT